MMHLVMGVPVVTLFKPEPWKVYEKCGCDKMKAVHLKPGDKGKRCNLCKGFRLLAWDIDARLEEQRG